MCSQQDGEDRFVLSFLQVSLILSPGESSLRFFPLSKGVFLTPCRPSPTHPLDIYATHIHPKLPNTEDIDEEQAFDLDYDVAQT